MTYVNPFRDAHYVSSDIDAGTDYCSTTTSATNPIYPVGRCRVLRPGTPSMTSTFGNDLSAYVLLDGPAQGLVIYTAEHYFVRPGHPTGSIVDVNVPLYDLRGCIEQGWGTSDGSQSLAWSRDYQESQCSRLGLNFDAFMQTLGVAPGHPRGGNPPSGVLPAGYPDWTAIGKDEAMYADWKVGWRLGRDGKPLPKNANEDVTLGFNAWHHDLEKDHTHTVPISGTQTVRTSKPVK
jgi:hypothetical protein